MVKRAFLTTIALSFLYLGTGFMFEPAVFYKQTKEAATNREREDGAIKNAIILYNKIFTDLYVSNGRVLRLNDFPASKMLRHELFRDLDFLRSRGLLLVYDNADIVFAEIKRPSSFTAEVRTFEEWNYLYRDIQTRENRSAVKGLGQGFEYLMRKQEGEWIVADVRLADVKPPEKKNEFLY